MEEYNQEAVDAFAQAGKPIKDHQILQTLKKL